MGEPAIRINRLWKRFGDSLVSMIHVTARSTALAAAKAVINFNSLDEKVVNHCLYCNLSQIS